MAITLYDSAAEQDKKQEEPVPTGIYIGTVVNNCDLVGQGKVLVRVPSLDDEIWARLTAIGGGSGAGFLYVPRKNDKVVVGVSGGDAFVLGGLWSSNDSPPVDNPQLEATTKRVIKTGLTEGTGHKLEFDDRAQSVEIETMTKQRITLEPKKIEVSNASGTLQVILDETSTTLTIKGVNVTIEAAAALTLKGRKIDIQGDPGPVSVTTPSACSISGKPIKLN